MPVVQRFLNGFIGGNVLERIDPPIELTLPVASRKFVWKTARLTVTFVDQDDLPIPSSQIRIGSYGPGGKFDFATVSSGGTIKLPVTEAPDAPAITGVAANGYGGRLLPGINGFIGGNVLERIDPPEELTSEANRKFTWQVAKGKLHILECTGSEISNASFMLKGTLLQAAIPQTQTGTFVALPVNDGSLYPTLTGVFANNYPFSVKLKPDDTFQGPVSLKLRVGKIFEPQFFLLNGLPYQLKNLILS